MSTSRKALKLVSILFIVLGIGTVALGTLGITSAQVPKGFDKADVMLYTVMMIAGGVLDVAIGIFGIRGANDPAKSTPIYAVSIIEVLYSITELGLSAFSGGADLDGIMNVAFAVLLFVLAKNVHGERAVH